MIGKDVQIREARMRRLTVQQRDTLDVVWVLIVAIAVIVWLFVAL